MDRKKLFWILIILIALSIATYLLFRERWAFPSFASYFNPFFDPSKIQSVQKAVDESVSNVKNAVKNSAGVEYFEKFLSGGKKDFETQLDGGKSFISQTPQKLEAKTTDILKDNLSGIYNAVGDALGIREAGTSTCR